MTDNTQTRTEPAVSTETGIIVGFRVDDVDHFLGVPYAEPPIGANRFRRPQAPRPWETPRAATRLGHPSVQTNPDYPAWLDPGKESEDCLFLNVWTPNSAAGAKRPVLVWIHGGAYQYGSAGAPIYDGQKLARSQDVVVVSINHRLNAFGYLWFGDIFPELAGHGNLGQRDLIAALGWVRDNISSFGGDSANITLFGESGGGAKIGALLNTEAAAGLFHRVIIQSGSQTCLLERQEATEVAQRFLKVLGVDSVEELQAADVESLKRATQAVENDLGVLAFQPVIDETLMSRQPWSESQPLGAVGLPMMIGMTRDESRGFIPEACKLGRSVADEVRDFFGSASLTDAEIADLIARYRCLTEHSADEELAWELTSDIWMRRSLLHLLDLRQASGGPNPTYVYEFRWRTPAFGSLWALHASELPFVFGNLAYPTAWDGVDTDASRAAADPGEQRYLLRDEMMAAWGAFARSGDPSTDRLSWPQYGKSKSTMIFQTGGSVIVQHPDQDRDSAIRHIRPGW
ncbi:carboxylesterase family protein [Microbacterium sp. X-17]|uniref:carboxylesterase/lipase family protein n=1 Tax=Microbacterium sp. X-17 TaxID=3144404 RepID=UPI0031F5424D